MSKKQIHLAVPETCHQALSLFAAPDIKLYFYRIKPVYQCTIERREKPVLYAPSFLALWALHYSVQNPHLFSSILCYGEQQYSPLAFMWFKLRLKIERYLMGSDVSSPIITRALRRHTANADYSALPIGTWLQLAKNYQNHRENSPVTLFWLDKHKNSADLHQMILKLQN
ncbi:putative membrane protein [Bartonella australis AUST/NH1]|uniref:Putative membrane protein n=1 Tax=Bartonella australis (strain Aust/NH1) TaxID=1094489 RepID=M1NTU1_BARAA|nr:hypothetical protein [Bartonella australis]AGF74728.1 putative membrane protein [Bartonella australis AUST/NH1]